MDIVFQKANFKAVTASAIDDKGFEIIIKCYYNEVFGYARSLCRNEALAKDLTQEAFFKFWKKRKKLKEGVLIKGWLYKTVRNKFLDHIKKYKKETHLLETAFADTLDDVVSKVHQEEIQRKIRIVEKEIDLLPSRCNQVFSLSKKEGLTNVEIARHLGISVKTVEGHLTKALRILRDKLKEKIQVLFLALGRLC
ncbi:RNA polymerase sigma factor [Flagellimonas pacifica]|uniref:RNA polymerase sigma-70 factor, ECF subfamily n=1 Tax=Flagellimonas pacifica TaxID=1247520 RepID=A0A285MW46_9FLAO|nr:RNA polymerase sigma-70 factor [Allomuricauda parva]SNZ01338.1 RNA polymerase sigma-70 factor, ECF subfamily [Allomuricauda parva]